MLNEIGMNEINGSIETQEAPVLREFGLVEQFHWLMGQNHSNHFSMAAEVTGKTTPAMWRDALDEVQRRHPFLNVRIGAEKGSKPVFLRANGCRIPLAVKERTSSLQWQTEFERELSTPFDASSAPLMRALLLRCGSRCEIILTTHHSIADGMSVVFIMRDLLQAVSGNKLAVLSTPPSAEELLARLVKTPPLQTTVPAGSRSVTSRPKNGAGASPRVRGLRLSQQQTSLLVEAARREHATVHAALSAALVMAGRQISPAWKEREVRVLSPISTRKILNAEDDCVILITGGTVLFDPPSDMGFWELARWAKQALLPSQTLDGVVAVAGRLDGLLAGNPDAEALSLPPGMAYELAVTNVQRAPFESKYGGLTVEALWGPCALNGFEGEQGVAAATVNGSLCLAHTSYTPFDSLLENATQLLMTASG